MHLQQGDSKGRTSVPQRICTVIIPALAIGEDDTKDSGPEKGKKEAGERERDAVRACGSRPHVPPPPHFIVPAPPPIPQVQTGIVPPPPSGGVI